MGLTDLRFWHPQCWSSLSEEERVQWREHDKTDWKGVTVVCRGV